MLLQVEEFGLASESCHPCLFVWMNKQTSLGGDESFVLLLEILCGKKFCVAGELLAQSLHNRRLSRNGA